MHAAMALVACCMEQGSRQGRHPGDARKAAGPGGTRGERVDVTRIAPGLFDATVYLADAEGATVGDIMLRVKLDLASGPVLRMQVEPTHP